ncbi:ATP-binding cassette domain-containing protein [Microbacterium excoecariae]|uniref:ATP-binding cassette domain-containing protein n=1 Tax=Microbacterium excoecariae TaxID=2715210 RepID=UPI00140AA237|nr:ATP-binding cassette domain-containing protein [Microbacterium excoecariae]NHI16506.1 ATP-binding cassette domain-containing protein [Microbacterium excoecariae]
MAGSDLAVEARGLVKTFGPTRAVDGIDLAIPRGGIYGVLGPNGAGKTTALRMLATLLRPDAGEARVLGHDVFTEPKRIRESVALTGQFASLDEDLTGIENLVLLGRLYGFRAAAARRRGMDLLEAFGLTEAAGRQVKKFSGGMRRRLDIAGSLIVTPRLMFLDEPTTGIDPRSRNQVWDIIRALVDGGTTILLTTQYLEEADQLAGRLAVIDHGRVIAEGTPGQLKAQVGAGALAVRLIDPEDRAAAAMALEAALGTAVTREADPAALSATLPDTRRAGTALAALESSGVEIETFSLGQPSLDEVFLALTGKPAEDAAPEGAAAEEGS